MGGLLGRGECWGKAATFRGGGDGASIGKSSVSSSHRNWTGIKDSRNVEHDKKKNTKYQSQGSSSENRSISTSSRT